MQSQYQKIAARAEEIAREVGRAQLRYFRSDKLHVDVKLNESDIVTDADKASEQIALTRIAEWYPHHAILSEESGFTSADDAEWLWIIDPLDGTTNFNEGLPIFSVSIAVQHRGTTVVGVVYAPYLDEMFVAIRGEGAWLNGRPATCRRNERMERAVISTGFPVDKDTNPDNNLDNLARVLPHVRGLRRLGSAAIDLCYVGAGLLDGYWELNLHLWDVAAGMLFVEEGGGDVEIFRTDRNICVIAASKPIFKHLKPLIK